VVILGCGPSGLIAAHAAQREFQARVVILSVKRPSQLFGCQYLHAPIPGISVEHEYERVSYVLHGTHDNYRKKVYGSLTPPVSPQQYVGDHDAWDLRYAYQQLWDMFELNINDVKIRPEDISPMMKHYSEADAFISSIPANVLCQKGSQHTFQSVPCWAIGDAPELGVSVPLTPAPFTVVCDGTNDVGWYRASHVFEHTTLEWPGHKRKPPITGVVPFEKPLSTDCDCMPSILRVGRYGQWRKGILSHEAYNDTAAHLEKVLA
jgi:hypothetical protein